MKAIVLLLSSCFISFLVFAQSDSLAVLHFDDSTLSSFQYYQKDSIGKKFTVVEKESEFRGGSTAWMKYLQKTVDMNVTTKYIKIKKGQKSATLQVKVAFIVDASGTPSDIKVINRDEVHPRLAAECIRIIEESPKWIPAQQETFVDEDLKAIEEKVKEKVSNKVGLKKVKSYKIQPMVFAIEVE